MVLCDQRMPGMSGVEFLKVVRERWPDVVRVIISGYTDAEDIIQGVQRGIYQYVTKPWPPDSLGGRALSRHERDGPTAVPSRARSLPAPYRPRRRALAAYTWLAPGGVTRAIGHAEQARLAGYVSGFGVFLKQLSSARRWNALQRSTAPGFDAWVQEDKHAANDFGQFLLLSKTSPAGSLYERWIFGIRPGDPFWFHAPMPDDARGEGLIEAARGALGHRLEVRRGASSTIRSSRRQPGVFRRATRKESPALASKPLSAHLQKGETTPIAVQHIGRSFDPRMVCTVH